MKLMSRVFPVAVAALGLSMLTACGGGSESGSTESKRAGVNEVIIHELGDPDMILPINSSSASSTYIEGNVFMTLLTQDDETYELSGFLAVDRPEIELIESGEFAGGMTLSFEIRPEAVWDNGTPVTADDYIFTIKSILNPKTDCEPLKPYFDFIGDIVVDPENNRKFTVYSKTTYMLVEEFAGYWVLPEYVYDPNQTMRKFSIKDLNGPEKRAKLKGNSDIIAFAEEFNSEKYQREKGFVVGCGPYQFEEWTTGQNLVLTRKKDWWGDKIDAEAFEANPDKLIYQIITDWTTAVTAMKDESIDLARGVETKKYQELTKNENFKSKFNLHSPDMFSYYYIGMNMRNPKLSDVKVRKALSHCVDKNEIIDVIMYGRAKPTTSMVHPTKAHFNDAVKGYDFDLEKAKALLDESGWVDSDGDGFRDKTIDGEMVPLKLEYKYNSGNEIRESIGLLFKENCRKVGVDVTIIAKEWTVFLEELDNHEFEISCGAWVFGPSMSDPKQTWHSASAVVGGSNYVGFGDAKSDGIIDELRMEPSEARRIELYKEFQQLVNDQAPYIFLFAPKERISIHNRFENAKAFAVRPGYNEKAFRLTNAIPAGGAQAESAN